MTPTLEAPAGLEGVTVATTTIGEVRGEEGFFHYRGRDATDLARHHRLEEVWHLLVVGHLPDPAELAAFEARLHTARQRLSAEVLAQVAGIARHSAHGDQAVAAVRTAWSAAAAALGCRSWLDLDAGVRLDQAVALSAIAPLLLGAVHHGRAVDDPAGRATAAALLELVLDRPADPAHVAALERYLVLTLDHGLNASTFTARTVTSTGADLGSVVVAGLGALSGPLHGGAPSRVLDMLDAIGTPDRAEAWVRGALRNGERIMGFGHRVYRTEDPRARLLRETARELGGTTVELAVEVERVVQLVLREVKPDRVLDVNVEYYAAVVLDAVGLPRELFTPTFAIARSIGWMAHALEQMEGNRIVRPSARYAGHPVRTDTRPAHIAEKSQ